MRGTRRTGRGGHLAAAMVVAALAACDLPTSPPRWNTEWVIPADSARISVAELLPGSVSIAPGGGAFLLSVPPVTFSRSLAQICPQCTAVHGMLVPKPAFRVTLSDEIDLPARVAAASLASGRIDVTLVHDFSFDPLRPPGATETGTITATVRQGAMVLGAATVSGADVEFPPNMPLARTIGLTAATLDGPLTIEVVISSPAGSASQPVRIDVNDRLTITAVPTALLVRDAAVTVQNQSISIDPVTLDLEAVDSFVVERVQGGALILDIENPFEVQGALIFTFDTPTGVITKPVPLQPGDARARVEFSREEVRRLLGNPVRLSAAGTVSGATGPVELRPDQVLVLRSRLELIIGSEG